MKSRPNNYEAVGLVSKSLFMQISYKSLISLSIFSFNYLCYEYLIRSINRFSYVAIKGVWSVRELHNTNITQPRDQISHLESYFCPSSTSGA